MFKRRHATPASPCQWHTESAELELSESELCLVVGGQSQPSLGPVLFHEAVATMKPVVGAVDPVLASLREGFHLVVPAGDYARWAAEYQESRELSQERGMMLDAEQLEAQR